MRREDAEVEAARRNRVDPEAERFEFYVFDESAGLADDAWAVGTRLRGGASTAPATYAGAARRRRPARDTLAPYEDTAAAAEPHSAPARDGWLEEPDVVPAPRRRPARPRREAGRRWRTIASQPSALGRWLERRRAAAGAQDADERPGLLVRSVGAAVMVTGMLWMVMVVVLAVLLRPDDLTGVALYLGAAVLGLLAILLGVAIRRS